VRGLAASHILTLSADETFTLDMLKKMTRTHFAGRSGFLNYIGVHELGGATLSPSSPQTA
jgi:hypothetical protein